MNQRALPLAGVKVVELGQLLAGPFAGTLLAYFGAEVIKVEPPGGDPIRGWRTLDDTGTSFWWRSLGRNKRSLTLDLKSDAGRELAARLIDDSDVLIENFRPGTLENWGLGPERFKESNPGLIYTRISGYGQDGPYADKPGYASVCEGIGGLRYVNGFPGERPVRPNLSLGDTVAGLHAALGIALALLERHSSKQGQVVDVALFESVFNLLEAVIPEFDGAGEIRQPAGSTVTGIVPTNTYRCADGKYVIIGGNGDSIFKRLMVTAERPDLAEDPRLAKNPGRVENEAEIDGAIEAWCATLPRRAGKAGSEPGALRPDLQRRRHDGGPALPGARPVPAGGDQRRAAENPGNPAAPGRHPRRHPLARRRRRLRHRIGGTRRAWLVRGRIPAPESRGCLRRLNSPATAGRAVGRGCP